MKIIFSLIFFIRQIIIYPKIIIQILSPKTIPVIIINFNQLFYLKELINFLFSRKFKNIVIIDNNSTYPPLLEYYDEIEDKVKIERRKDNLGHTIFFRDSYYLKKYGKGFYILTDPDIIPNNKLPKYFLRKLLILLIRYLHAVTKVGFALKIDNIPSYYPLINQVKNWESKYWDKIYLIQKNVYRADIDTTFALYKPGFKNFNDPSFFSALRIAGEFTAIHGGWYINPKDMTDEQKYFIKKASNSSSWKLNENGELNNKNFIQSYKIPD